MTEPSLRRRGDATRGTILIVDADPSHREGVRESLAAADYQVQAAASGEEALRCLDEAIPEVIILDASLPGIDGFETCARIRADPKWRETPVILMSTLDDPADKARAFEHGAVDIIAKPVDEHEVRARVDAQVSLVRLRGQLGRRNEDMEAFGRMLGHDLRGSLATILAQTEVIIDDVLSGDVQEDGQLLEDLQTIKSATLSMSETINAMLVLASVGEAKPNPQVVQMSAIIHQARFGMAAAIERAGALIEVGSDLPPALGHAPWLEQVWSYLIGNGLEFGGTPPRLVLGARPCPGQEAMVTFFMQDNGPGIPEASLPRLFGPFTRHRRERVERHGIGLSIVERVITTLGGEVGARRLPEGGTELFFTLRRADAATSAPVGS